MNLTSAVLHMKHLFQVIEYLGAKVSSLMMVCRSPNFQNYRYKSDSSYAP